MFVLNSDITIGSFQFSGVHEVRIRKSMHTLTHTATITLPSIGKIISGKKASPVIITTGDQFEDGDPVTINLGYSGVMQTEFMGFVKKRDLAMPLVVECEGYSRLMKLNVYTQGPYPDTSAAQLLNLAIAGQGINLQVGNDMPMVNITLRGNNGVEIVDFVKRISQNILNIFFIADTTLWCGLPYTPFSAGTNPFNLGQVNFRLGYNTIKDNALKEKTLQDNPVTILFNGTLANGERVMTQSDIKVGTRKDKSVFNNIGDVDTMQQLANEKQRKMNYAGYQGSINAFLQPFCLPGWTANIVDDRYPERNGVYLIEGTEVIFGVNGAQRKVEIGPKLGFSNNG